MFDVILLRYVRMSTLLHILCHLWGECARSVPSISERRRRTEATTLFCNVMELVSSALSRTGRLLRPSALKSAVVMARYVGWSDPPQDMARSVKGRIALMVMAFDQVFMLWEAMPKHSRNDAAQEFGAFMTAARRCFRADGRVLERASELDALLARHHRLVER